MPRRMTIPACMAMLCNIFAAVLPTLVDDIRIARAQELPYRKTGQEKIDALFAPLAGAHSPGMAVLVIKDGQRFFERGYGVRNLNSATKIDERTNFRLASCSKQFTAMATMHLVHDGKLRYGQ